jgi:hypothetical protein
VETACKTLEGIAIFGVRLARLSPLPSARCCRKYFAFVSNVHLGFSCRTPMPRDILVVLQTGRSVEHRPGGFFEPRSEEA